MLMAVINPHHVYKRKPLDTWCVFPGDAAQVPHMRRNSDSEARRQMGSRLQAIREVLGMTQQAMASAAGVGVTTVSAWESGRNQMDLVKLAKLAMEFGFTTDWVALGDLSGVRFDLALKLQARARAAVDAAGQRRGRPARKPPADPPVPVVRDADDGTPPPPPRTLHEPPPPLMPTGKHT